MSTGVGSGVSVGMGTEVGVRSGSGAEVGTGGAGVGVSVAAEDTVVDTGLAKEVGLVEDSSVPPHPAATKSNIRRIRLVLILLLSRSLVHWLETRINRYSPYWESSPTFPISTLQGLPQSATELPDIAGYQSTMEWWTIHHRGS